MKLLRLNAHIESEKTKFDIMLPKIRDFLVTQYHDDDVWISGGSPTKKVRMETAEHHAKYREYLIFLKTCATDVVENRTSLT